MTDKDLLNIENIADDVDHKYKAEETAVVGEKLNIVVEDTLEDFPEVGKVDQKYYSTNNSCIYRWNADEQSYTKVSGDDDVRIPIDPNVGVTPMYGKAVRTKQRGVQLRIAKSKRRNKNAQAKKSRRQNRR